MKKALLIIITLFVVFRSFSQEEDRPLRIEIEAEDNADIHRIVPFGKKGLIFFYAILENKNDSKYKWVFTQYDTNFTQTWRKEVFISLPYRISNFVSDSSFVYLFLEKKFKSASTNEFIIVKVDAETGDSKIVEGTNPDNSVLSNFEVCNNCAFLGGYKPPSGGQSFAQGLFSITLVPLIAGVTVLKYQPSLICVNLATGNVKSLSEPIEGQGYVENIDAFSNENTVFVSIKNFIQRKTNKIMLCQYNSEGTKTETSVLVSDNPLRKLSTVNIIPFKNREKIIVGTYNNNVKGKSANPAFTGVEESSTGIYITKVVDNKQLFTKFYNFADFKNFFSYLNDKQEMKMKMRAKKKQAQGKELSFNYSLLIHDVIEREDNYILLAEVYYPEYHTETYTSYDAYGQPYTTSYTIFDGYRYTSALIACFDKSGNLLWDNTFEIWNILTFNITEKVKVLFDGEEIILSYSSDGKIASKIISGDKVIESKDFTEIQTSYSKDELISDYNSDMDYWYDNYFITYGYQKIQNREKGKKGGKRNVFYFNKIAFR